MGLLDSPFGLALRFDVSGLSDLRHAHVELGSLIQRQREAANAARLNNTLTLAQRRGLIHTREEYGLSRMKLQELEAQHRFAATSVMAVGGAMLGMGILGVRSLKGMVDASADWEKRMTTIQFVTGLQADEMARVSTEAKNLAITMAMGQDKIADIMTEVGKQGVTSVAALKSVTQEVAILAGNEAGAGQAAARDLLMVARMWGKSGDELASEAPRISSALIAVSNATSGASIQIADMVSRAGSFAKAAGFTEAQTIGLAGSVSNLVKQAQLGGTGLGKFFQMLADAPKMAKALNVGEPFLRAMQPVDRLKFAVNRLRQLQEGDGAAGTTNYTKALKGMGMNAARGGQVMGALVAASMEHAETVDGQTRMVSDLNKVLGISDAAYTNATASAERLTMQQKTLSYWTGRFHATVEAIRTELGDYLRPAVQAIVEGMSWLLEAFRGLPEPIKKVLVWTAAFGSVATLVIGGTLLLAGSLAMAYLSIGKAMVRMGIEGTVLDLLKKKTRALTIETKIFQKVQGAFGRFFGGAGRAVGKLGTVTVGAFAWMKTGLLSFIVPLRALAIQYMPWVTTVARVFLGLFSGPVGWGLLIGGAIAFGMSWDKITAKIGEAFRAVGILWDVFKTGETSIEGLNLLKKLGLEDLGVTLGMIGYEIDAFFKGFSSGSAEMDAATSGWGEWGDVFMFALDEVGKALSPIWDMLKHVFGMDETIGTKEGISKAEEFGNTMAYVLGLIGQGFKFALVTAVPVIKLIATGIAFAVNMALIPLRVFKNSLDLIWDVLKFVGKALLILFNPNIDAAEKGKQMAEAWKVFKADVLGDVGDIATAFGDAMIATFGLLGDAARNWSVKFWKKQLGIEDIQPVPVVDQGPVPQPGGAAFVGPAQPPVTTPPVPTPPVVPHRGRTAAEIQAAAKAQTAPKPQPVIVNVATKVDTILDDKVVATSNAKQRQRARSRQGNSRGPRMSGDIGGP